MALPFTHQELRALLLLGATGLAGVTVPLVTRAAPPPQAPAVTVRLNAASAEELATLQGIGPALARRIVEERQRHGRFLRVEDLSRVKGLTPTRIARLKAHLRLE